MTAQENKSEVEKALMVNNGANEAMMTHVQNAKEVVQILLKNNGLK